MANEDVKKQLLALKDEAIAGYEYMKPQLEALERAFKATIDEGQRTSLKKRRKSTVAPQLIFPKVAKTTRDVMNSFFGTGELCRITPESLNNPADAEMAEALYDELEEYAREARLYIHIKPVVRDTLAYGTSVCRCVWSVEKNQAVIERVLLNDFYFDPHAKSTQNIKYAVHRVQGLTIAELKKRFSGFKDWESLDGQTGTGSSGDIGDYKRVTLYEVYRLLDGKWTLSTFAGDELLREDEELKDGFPFVISVLEEQFISLEDSSVRAYGASFIEPMMPIQTEYIIRRNQQIDAIDLQLNQRFITTKMSGVSEEDLISNRKKITVDDMNSIKELPAPRIDSSIFDVDRLEGEIQEISGITKYSQGLNDRQNLNQTATGISILTQEGAGVISDITRAFNEMLFRPLFIRLINLIYKYKESSRFARLNRSVAFKHQVIVDVGLGSTNKEIMSNALDGATQMVMGAINLFAGMQDTPRVQLYSTMLDEMISQKLKLLNLNSIAEEAKTKQEEQEEQEKQQLQQQQQQEQQAEPMMGDEGMGYEELPQQQGYEMGYDEPNYYDAPQIQY